MRVRWAAIVVVALVALAGCAGVPTTDLSDTAPGDADLDSPPPDPTGADPNDPDDTAWIGTVVRVVDGDTMEIEFPNGEVDTVRLLGVDTPETSAGSTSPAEFEGIPETDAGRAHLRAWGIEASAFAESELAGEEVTVVTGGDRRGGYGRLLAVLYVDGEDFNERLLTEGYARLYDTEFALRDAYAAAEADARERGVGLWDFDESDYPTEVSEVDDADLPPLPADGDYDCSDFDTRAEANAVLDRIAGDPHDLDADGDGKACESLPSFGVETTDLPVSA
ncbi:thermonuclease family protein [Halorubrum sp. GN11GM_10-3_MGM]|uniref:thermonuclease family protein n=1 Tax=Halorubrum sp. GN11GM_10-3_MGM TaxID=2518111 RepID=UPI0010F8C78A|nr:thermonuclease family protein [Halorubrum sp. GN11GM_10-3_MGM]TKX70966.1 nuclease [Halorubrum sp. GN11GM_10-3_MGM]